MKTSLKYPALLLIVCFTIWACTKKIETIISIDYEINEDFESEGFVNGSLPTTVNIVPIQVLEGFDYFIKYEVESGNGFYSSGSGIIASNEFIPLTGLNFTANYIPSSPGTHTVKFTIRDEVGLEESTTLTYTISNLDLNWVATTNVIQAGIGQEIPITLTFANNTEGSTATFTRTIRLTSGTATLSNSAGAVALNTKAGITPGTYNFIALASETGTLTIEFELEDNRGQTNTTRVSIDITTEPVNQPPIAVASADITNGTAPLTVQFDGSGSTDPEESTLTYSWNLTNESSTFNETLTGVSPTYEFATPGTYTATLTVTDNDEATGTDTVEITVSESDNAAPTASASADVLSGPAPLTVNFDGSGSMDSDGTISGYSWDFGDGGSGSGATPSHEFTDPGTYTVTLTVTDDGNATGTDIIEITVSESDNAAPTASASADVVSGSAPLEVDFDGSGSRDSDGTIMSYSWELSNGVTLSGVSPGYTFDTPGEYTASLTVTDNDGETATDRIDITVSEPEPENTDPVANDDAGTIIAGETLTIDILENDRDDDGDALIIDMANSSTSIGSTILNGNNTVTYTPPNGFSGEATFTYRVIDDNGGSDTAVLTITVREPVANASASINVSTVRFSSSWDGNDEEANHLTYLWNFGDGNTSTLANPTHTYTRVREYNVTLTITDRQERRYEDNVSVTIDRLTDLNLTTGIYTAPPGSSLLVEINCGGSTNGSVTVDTDPFIFSRNLSWETGSSIEIFVDTFMPADSNRVTFSGVYGPNPNNLAGGCIVRITHVSSGEEHQFQVSYVDDFPR